MILLVEYPVVRRVSNINACGAHREHRCLVLTVEEEKPHNIRDAKANRNTSNEAHQTHPNVDRVQPVLQAYGKERMVVAKVLQPILLPIVSS